MRIFTSFETNLWKTNLELFTIIDREADRQMHSLPEAEVVEWHFQHGYTFNECMRLRFRLRGDCIWRCWN